MSRSVRLIFPHQLFAAVARTEEELILLIEHPLFFTQYRFHIQKLMLHRASMQDFCAKLRKAGREVRHIQAAEFENADLEKVLGNHLKDRCEVRVYDLVDDWLEQDVEAALENLHCGLEVDDSPGFLCNRDDLAHYRRKSTVKGPLLMADFYRWQRKRLNILVDGDKRPPGGQWSFDAENRKRLPKDVHAPTLPRIAFTAAQKSSLNAAREAFSDNPGESDFNYPLSHKQAENWLNDFLEQRFGLFGDYEDSMSSEDATLFHSVLSSSLNIGLLTPRLVVSRALKYAEGNGIPLNSLEGFVRQIIGWREFIRATYLWRGRDMRTRNFFGFNRKLPEVFCQDSTGIAPLDIVIGRIRKLAYAHHIERLMVLGTFMLLCETDPDEVYEWFMSFFIDAYDWVMVPNVYAMSQYADGGSITTKPYLCGSNYLRKMSDFPKGDWETVWDALYWNFIARHRKLFLDNPRTSMSVRAFDKFSAEKKASIHERARGYLTGL